MTTYLIRVEGELSPDLTSAFPQLKADVELVQTLLTGSVEDAAELTGIINLLNTIGVEIVEIVEIVRFPDRHSKASVGIAVTAGPIRTLRPN